MFEAIARDLISHQVRFPLQIISKRRSATKEALCILIGSVLPRTNHSWNAVKIVDKWELIDCAWACAYNAYDNSYFLAAPDEFIYENFPESEEWQLLDEPICISQFWDMPQCTAAFFKSNLRLNGSAASALYPLAGSIHSLNII